MATLLLGSATMAAAQQSAKVYRVGIVSPLSGTPEAPTVRAFRQALRELGYVEGKNVIVEARFAEGRPKIFPDLVADLIRRKVDVIVVGSGTAALSAKKATSTIPIVFAGIQDPVASGLVANLARPAGNITGATYGAAGPRIGGKWLELLREAIPAIASAAVLYDAAEPANDEYLGAIHAAARSLGISVGQFEAGNDTKLEKAFAAMSASGAQGVVVMGSAYYGGNRTKLVRHAADNRLPAIYFFNLFPEAGGLMSYGGSVEDSYRRAAAQVDRILKGANPADLPVDQASKYELVINLKAAKALGITIPRSLVQRADRVIE